MKRKSLLILLLTCCFVAIGLLILYIFVINKQQRVDIASLDEDEKLVAQEDLGGRLLILKDDSSDQEIPPDKELVSFFVDDKYFDGKCTIQLPKFNKEIFYSEQNFHPEGLTYRTEDYRIIFHKIVEINDKYNSDFLCSLKTDSVIIKKAAERTGCKADSLSSLTLDTGYASLGRSDCSISAVFCLPDTDSSAWLAEIHIDPESFKNTLDEDKLIETLNSIVCSIE